jgi:branched-chain amino acid aminotransferase
MEMPNYAFFKGEIVPMEQAKISVMTHALNYGTAAFGGMRAYWNHDQGELYLFRPIDHFTRLLQSASMLRMNIPYTPEELTSKLSELLRTEGYKTNTYIRPLVYKSQETIGVRVHDIEDDITMFAMPFGTYLKQDGLHLGTSAWRRIDDNAIPARGKIAGAYANSALIKSDAVLAGYDDAIVLNEDGHVSESSGANIFIVRGGTVITPPIHSNILEGITRRTLMALMRDEMGLEIVERDIDRTELYLAEEIFLCGTAVQVAGVTRIDHRQVGDGKLGQVTTRLTDVFMDVVAGRVPKYHDLLTPVYQAERV